MDTSRMTITTRLESSLHGLQAEFKGIYDTNDAMRAAEALVLSFDKSDYPTKLAAFFEILDKCGIPHEFNENKKYKSNHERKEAELNYYLNLVKTAEFPSFPEIEFQMLDALFQRFEIYPAPEEYMQRIVNRLSNQDDGWENDTLRLRILKQFVKYGNSLKDAGYGGGPYINRYARNNGCPDKDKKNIDIMLSFVDDDVFKALETADGDQRRANGTYGLLKLADDLALGKFRTQGATKPTLYLFAMVYGMTYYYGEKKGIIFDPKSDIDINLFRDYYTNNFIRFITTSYIGRLNEYETDPSGQGINYKNYAEMVYLYFITKDMPPADKIRCSAKMIERIKKKMLGKAPTKNKDKNGTPFASRDYKEQVYSEDILGLDEDKFEAFLCDYYNCDVSKVLNNRPILLESSQNSAFSVYKEIIEKIIKRGAKLRDCNYGLWFTDTSGFYTKSREKLKAVAKGDLVKLNSFMLLLRGVNNYLGVETKEVDLSDDPRNARDKNEISNAIPRSLCIDSPEGVTRASIITAFYYLYNKEHESDDLYRTLSFEEHFNNYKTEADKYLDRAHYNLFSGRDLFDVLTAFSSFAYIYL